MKKTLIIIALVLSFSGFSQKISETIESNKKKERRDIEVYLPNNYESNKTKKYPVLYLLDGNYLADPFTGIIKYGNYWEDLPEVIIVSINQEGETRYKDCFIDETGMPAKSGANFFEFIGFELIPFIETKYRALPFRMIAGHDTTAGFLNYFLFKPEPIFNAYISLSPEIIDGFEEKIADRLTALKQNLFYYQASSNGDLAEIQQSTKIIDDLAKEIKKPNLFYQFDFFQNTTHYSLVAQAIPSALYFIFSGYQPISKLEFDTKIVTLEKGFAQYLIDKFEGLEKKFGLKMKPRFSDFKAIEAAILKNKAYAELQQLSVYALKQYPKGMLGVYHQALFYEKVGELKKATKEYKKSFMLEESGEVTKDYMLGRMEAISGKPDDSKIENYPDPSPVPATPEEPKKEEPKKD